jgi:hypothetical protein
MSGEIDLAGDNKNFDPMTKLAELTVSLILAIRVFLPNLCRSSLMHFIDFTVEILFQYPSC